MNGKILIIDDEKLICWSLKTDLEKEGYEVFTAQTAREGFRLFEEEFFDVVLLDIRLPDGDGKEILKRMHRTDPLLAVILITANEDIRSAVECMRAGAYNYLHKPFEFEELRLNIEKAVEGRRLKKRMTDLESQERGKYDFHNIIAESRGMKAVLDIVRRVAESEASTILLTGESGTGKDLIAKTIHYAGSRSGRPFVSINCAAIPETLLESELFGFEKGAFTDARQSKKGLVEEASHGTLFLDEIGDMPRELQAKLLHLMDQKKFRKVGGLKEIESDIRILAATHRDLKVEVAEGRFRQDLFYRLHVLPITIPPLRERKEDIPALVHFFMDHFNREFKKSIDDISEEAMEVLVGYEWPGNVRELRNIIERMMILNRDEQIQLKHLPLEIYSETCVKEPSHFRSAAVATSLVIPPELMGAPLETIEKHVLLLTLEKTKWNQSRAAKILGIGRDALRYKIQKLGLSENAQIEEPAA
ncbi:MAG: sigma-54-dependent Fis family transcriptional regulator [Candidatus Omnitrophica bacterium]|nr:sigma-54-dependent Fis family transcriptional regulator [Candidatus Omnitrophota bacterium]